MPDATTRTRNTPPSNQATLVRDPPYSDAGYHTNVRDERFERPDIERLNGQIAQIAKELSVFTVVSGHVIFTSTLS